MAFVIPATFAQIDLVERLVGQVGDLGKSLKSPNDMTKDEARYYIADLKKEKARRDKAKQNGIRAALVGKPMTVKQRKTICDLSRSCHQYLNTIRNDDELIATLKRGIKSMRPKDVDAMDSAQAHSYISYLIELKKTTYLSPHLLVRKSSFIK